MKNILIYVSRVLVGSLLIVSGIIKANDALGFSYKLNEYFTEGILGMEFLRPYTLAMAAFICIFEVVLGIALIFGLKAKLTTTLNLLMMLFFTFLTFYSAYFDKVKDCGCFGDALKLTPWESFTKDAVLLVFSLILFLFRKQIHPNSIKDDNKYIWVSLVLVAVFSVGVIGWGFPVIFSLIVFVLLFVIKRFDKNQWRQLALPIIATTIFTVYCYNHLPIRDFRPYKVSANIKEGMEVPKDALPQLIEYTWVMDVNGERKTFVGDYPSIEGAKLIESSFKILREAPEPPIHDFTIEGENDDTELYLSKDNVLTIVAYDFSKSSDEGFKEVKKVTDEAIKKGYTVIGLTAESLEQREALKKKYNLNFDFFFCDGTTLKTVVRANPGIVEMDKATVKQKFHWNDIEDLEL